MANRDQPNEGEGNRTAARTYNKAQRRFVESGKVAAASRKAADALEGKEAAELAKAEKIGKSKIAEEDRLLRRK